MPPRRPREPRPQSRFCRYDLEGPRCRRIATVNGELCREHAVLLSTQLESGSPLHDFVSAVDREVTRATARDPVLGAFVGMIGSLFRPVPAGSQPGHSQRAQQQQQRSQHPPRPSSPPPPDPSAAARVVLGFEPTEPLTKDKISDRKKALARVFHPDLAGGSEAHMKRINQAADVLLAKLA